MSLQTPTLAPLPREAQPPCPECAVALHPAGLGRHLYWTCRYCGVTLRRA